MHKYLYANADPVDRNDPSGYGDSIDTTRLDFKILEIGFRNEAPRVLTRTVPLRKAATAVVLVMTAAAIAVEVGKPLLCGFSLTISGLAMALEFQAGDQVQRVPCGFALQKPQEEDERRCDPNLRNCSELYPKGYCTLDGALSALSCLWGKDVIIKNPDEATARWKQDCGLGRSMHFSLGWADGTPNKPLYPGSIGCCECCDEPTQTTLNACTILNANHDKYVGRCAWYGQP